MNIFNIVNLILGFRNNSIIPFIGIGLFLVIMGMTILTAIFAKNWKKKLYFSICSLTSYLLSWFTFVTFGWIILKSALGNSINALPEQLRIIIFGDDKTGYDLFVSNPIFGLVWWICFTIVFLLVDHILWLLFFRYFFKVKTKKNKKAPEAVVATTTVTNEQQQIPQPIVESSTTTKKTNPFKKILLLTVCTIFVFPNVGLFSSTILCLTSNYKTVRSNGFYKSFDSLICNDLYYWKPTDLRYIIDFVQSVSENHLLEGDIMENLGVNKLKDTFNISGKGLDFGDFTKKFNDAFTLNSDDDGKGFGITCTPDSILQIINDTPNNAPACKNQIRNKLIESLDVSYNFIKDKLIKPDGAKNIVETTFDSFDKILTRDDEINPETNKPYGDKALFFHDESNPSLYHSSISRTFGKEVGDTTIAKIISHLFIPTFIPKIITSILDSNIFNLSALLSDQYGYNSFSNIVIPINFDKLQDLKDDIETNLIGTLNTWKTDLTSEIDDEIINLPTDNSFYTMFGNDDEDSPLSDFSNLLTDSYLELIDNLNNEAVNTLINLTNSSTSILDIIKELFDTDQTTGGFDFNGKKYDIAGVDNDCKIHLDVNIYNKITSLVSNTLLSNTEYSDTDKENCYDLVDTLLSVFFCTDTKRNDLINWIYN